MKPISSKILDPLSAAVLASLMLLAGTATPTVAQKGGAQEGTVVHPLLQPLVERPSEEIPEYLRTDIGGQQGRWQIDDRPALSLHIRTDASQRDLEAVGARVRTWAEGRATIDILPERLRDLVGLPTVYAVTLPRILKRILEESVPVTGVDHLRSEAAGVFSGLDGDGVIVGVVDTGIDLNHPNFKDASGNTRLLYVLDQPAGNIECTAAMIDSLSCGQVDGPSGHGTHVTGIAAGNGAATNQAGNTYETVGVAPSADIIMVKTSFASDDIEDAITYIFDKADALGKPAVVNLSLGTHLGAHDGTDSMEQHIDTLVTAQDGRAVVIAAGNEREDEIHAERKTLPMVSVVGPDFEIGSYSPTGGLGNDVVYAVGYYPAGQDLIAHLWTPSGQYLTMPKTFGAATCTVANTVDGYIYLCNSATAVIGTGTSAHEVLVAILDFNPNTGGAAATPGVGTWQMGFSGMNVPPGGSEIDFWLVGTTGAERFLNYVDEQETVGIPGTAEEAITVGSHNTKICWTDQGGNPRAYANFGIFALMGDISWFSSWGPTRDGRSKPDLVAPGAGIVSARASTVSPAVVPSLFYTNNDYMLVQGTSQAAPHVAGAAALLFEQDPTYDHSDIKSLLLSNTNESFMYRNPIWPGVTTAFWDPVFGNGMLDLAFLGTDPYETNDQHHYPDQILSGETVNSFIGAPGDHDWFQVMGMAPGDTLEADLTGLPADYDLDLYSVSTMGTGCHNSGPIADHEASSNNSGTTPESASATLGWWFADYIRVSPAGFAWDDTVPYVLNGVINRPEIATSHSTLGSAQQLPAFKFFKVTGDTVGELDYYRIYASSGQTITASLPGSGFGGPRARIYNGAGVLISGTGVSVSAVAPSSGNYYVRVHPDITPLTPLPYTLEIGLTP